VIKTNIPDRGQIQMKPPFSNQLADLTCRSLFFVQLEFLNGAYRSNQPLERHTSISLSHTSVVTSGSNKAGRPSTFVCTTYRRLISIFIWWPVLFGFSQLSLTYSFFHLRCCCKRGFTASLLCVPVRYSICLSYSYWRT
jgi:hypothetical protein